jgi:hypothetical protein
MKKAFSIGFVAVLLSGLLLTLLLPDRAFSDMENRVLQPLPAPTLSAVFSGEWMEKMEKWLADQFPGRTFFVRAKASLSYALGQREIGGAYIGAGGRLFERFDRDASTDQLEKNAAFLSRFAQSRSGRVYFLPVYSAFTLYPESLPAFAEFPDERAILSHIQLPENVLLVDPLDALVQAKDEPVYFRTDHHWTQRGAYEAYLQFCAAAGLTPRTDLAQLHSPNPFYGSLFSKAPLWGLAPDEMSLYEIPGTVRVTYDGERTSDSLYTLSALEKKDQYTAFLDGNHAIVDIETDAGTGRSLIVLKDSFAHALVPLLAGHYDRITMIDLRYYNLPLTDLLAEKPESEVLLTYNLSWFAQDNNLFKLTR